VLEVHSKALLASCTLSVPYIPSHVGKKVCYMTGILAIKSILHSPQVP